MARSILLVWVLVGTGVVLGCDWDQSVVPDQDLSVIDGFMIDVNKISEVSDPESCRSKCCSEPDCDMALVRFPADGKPQCILVKCLVLDQDVCVLEPATQSKVYRKNGTRESGRKQARGGEGLRAVPLMVPWNPRSDSVSQEADRAKSREEKEMSASDFTEHCGAEPEVGPCRAAFQHWYYNSETGTCQSFIYGGCKGNKNNYNSKERCMATCAVRVLPSSEKVVADDDDMSSEYREGCMVTSDPGLCRAAFPMFYYDVKAATCRSFIYGGCGGNQNRYSTMEECVSRCSGEGSFDHRGKVRDRWTAGVFLFVTLATVSALMLVTLVVITMRRHRLTRQPSSISDKEELLPEADDQSSLESLSIPESPK
ncbi:kunitz-type protease inhibitor 2-like [Pungitius pungitius]|uniref:kunitz-type protease inhibitor 2-like n=1 Tax=Pungitius pungitius TaxID=134920 RepID=UPI001888722B|nr:kunitz-type protease inhibitor 2-like [Pungitius pungitius]